MKKFAGLVLVLALLIALVVPAQAEAAEGKTLRIIATSDLHGKFMPWDYALNAESPSGSMVQLATAIAQYRDDNTLLVDAGDTIQVKGGILSPECDNSWKITGNDWDPALHQKAVEMIAAGELSVPASEDGKHLNAKAITENDLMK